MAYLLILLNAVRFIGLEYSPPGFYMDEAAGATQVMCIAQDGYDFYGVHYPLFAAGFPGFGLYTPTYLYGQIAWTSIFGHSIAAFRSFSAFVTVLTVWFLYLFVRNTSNKQTALYVAFAATIMPWAFQFSRIAWDPPVAVMFLIAALWATTWKRYSWIAGLLLALAAYSYPPMRITAPLILFLYPGMKIKDRLLNLAVFLVCVIPIVTRLSNPEFIVRSTTTAIWSDSFISPYTHLGIFNLPTLFVVQVLKHFSPEFLFVSGDKNHLLSIHSFGMLSWLDAILYFIGGAWITLFLINRKRKRSSLQIDHFLLLIAVIGILSSVVPAALTHEGIPHALRSIGAWPFYSIVSGIILYSLSKIKVSRLLMPGLMIGGLLFYGSYLYHYFINYPKTAIGDFKPLYNPIDFSYLRMQRDGLSCKQARLEPTPRLPYEIVDPETPKLGETIAFSSAGDGDNYLGNYWQNQEPWGVWSNGQIAVLNFPMPENAHMVALKVKPFITPAFPSKTVQFWVNGHYEKTIVFSKDVATTVELVIPGTIKSGSKLEIALYVEDPNSPLAAGIGSDPRVIGIGILEAIFK